MIQRYELSGRRENNLSVFGRPFAGRFVLIFQDSSANLRPTSVPWSVVQVKLSLAHIHPNAWETVQSLSCSHGVPARGSDVDSFAKVYCDWILMEVKSFSVSSTVSDSLTFAVHERSDDFFCNLSHKSVVVSGLIIIETTGLLFRISEFLRLLEYIYTLGPLPPYNGCSHPSYF